MKVAAKAAVILCALLLSPYRAVAEDDIVIVPAQQQSLAIPEVFLTRNDHGGSSILGHSPAGRGDLEQLAGALAYTPGEAFTQVGLDSFSYETASFEDPRHTVFLVRGLDQVLVADGLTEQQGKSCELAAGWALTPGGQAPTVSMQGDGACAVVYDFSSGSDFAQLASARDPVLPGPGGGYTEFTLDGGGDPLPGGGSNENLIAVGTTMGEDGQPQMIFGLRRSGAGVIAMALEDDGSLLESPVVPLTEQSHSIGLTWWFEGRGRTANGGLILEVDGEMVARLRQVRNNGFLGQPVDWAIGPQNIVGLQGAMIFTSAALWVSPDAPRFAPFFSDHGFVSDLWDRTVNPGAAQNAAPPGSSDVMWFLGVDPRSGRTQLVDELSESMSSYHARFHLAVDRLVAASTASMTFFEAEILNGDGETERAGTRPFRLELIHRPFSGYAVRASVEEGSFQGSTTWVDVPSTGFSVVEVAWIAESAAGVGDGRLHLAVNANEQTLAAVAAGAEGIGEVRLGPCDISPGLTGSLVVDQFDSWQ